MGAYPVALTKDHGEFHSALMESARRHEGGRYAASVDVAEEVAAELGMTIESYHKEPGPAVRRFKSSADAATAAIAATSPRVTSWWSSSRSRSPSG
ncbi:hypothetical protein E4K10_30295 [Streptomyces sp. T1317-0309]|nr:hypothetical protein E4K10_30295 [Streptomyces sp. T1317-0309]